MRTKSDKKDKTINNDFKDEMQDLENFTKQCKDQNQAFLKLLDNLKTSEQNQSKKKSNIKK